MFGPSQPMMKWMILALAVVVIGLGFGFYVVRLQNADPDDANKDHLPGFREMAREAGITFRMAFLPGEQGEKFKINLYDHGCGVAVGDYDGDGFDDIYFANQ